MGLRASHGPGNNRGSKRSLIIVKGGWGVSNNREALEGSPGGRIAALVMKPSL